jgi:hypothetical protein
MQAHKERESRFQIDRLEERIAPSPTCPVPANENALPPDNPGTSTAAGHIPTVAQENWFGQAACDEGGPA